MKLRRSVFLVLCVLAAAGASCLQLLSSKLHGSAGPQHDQSLYYRSLRRLTWSSTTVAQPQPKSPIGHTVSAGVRELLQQVSSLAAVTSNSSQETTTAADTDADADSLWVTSLQQQQQPTWVRAANVQAQDENCPGCMGGFCFSTEQGFRCTSCQGSLFVSRADGSCGCPAGRYQPADQAVTCKDCEKGSFCLGGKYTAPGTPGKTACSTFGEGFTTLGLRSTSKKLCVNLPGYLYGLAASGDPTATPCPEDTYGPGLRKQRACPACPTGFITYGRTKQNSIQSCSVSPGYFQITPGRVAPCPRGSYKPASAPGGNCTQCIGAGVTTPGEASVSEKNCSDVTAGSFATSVVDGVVKKTARCLQNYYCPGGTARQSVDLANLPASDPTLVRCPRGMWTQGLGSNNVDSCVTPPGHFTSATETLACPNGEYRTGWVPAAQAASCVKCSPDGSIQSMATDILVVYRLDGTETSIMVKSGVVSCYIVGGQGLVFDQASNTFRAVNCDNNNWGVTDNTYGLKPSTVCQNCPANLITSKNPVTNPISSGFYKADNSTPPRGGFTAQGACVTRPGWGVVNNVPTPCPVGSWSAGDSGDPCTACGFGLTTGANSTQASAAECGIAPGFGWLRNSVAPCPVGTFNDQIRANNRTPCAACPGGSTNTVEGAASKASCNLCRAGFGGAACDVCGGDKPNFGPGTRPIGTACVECPGIGGADGGGGVGGFQFLDPKGGKNWFTPRVIAAISATNPSECIGEFTQIVDDAWSLAPQDPADWGFPPVTVETFTDCTNLCTFDEACQFVQFDYQSTENNCRLKVPTANSFKSESFLAFKALASTDLGASGGQGRRLSTSLDGAVQQLFSSNVSVRAKSVVASGRYTIWRDLSASRIGQQQDPSQGIPLNYDTCFKACDEEGECAGVYMTLTAINAKPGTCKLIFGDKTPGTFKRSVTRMVAKAENMDMWTIMGFS